MYKGIIGRNGLDDFWDMLLPDEQMTVTRCYVEMYSEDALCIVDHMDGTDDQEVRHIEAHSPIEDEDVIGEKKCFFLAHICLAVLEKDIKLFNKISDYIFNIPINMSADEDLIDAHFMYEEMAMGLHARRDIYDFALDLCIAYCKKDMNLFGSYKKALKKQWGNIPLIETIKQLAIIYEKAGKYEEALSVCQFAVDNGLDDGTKSGYPGRIERIKKKRK